MAERPVSYRAVGNAPARMLIELLRPNRPKIVFCGYMHERCRAEVLLA